MSELIRKAAGILIKDKRLLVVRSRGKDFFMSPGGKIEKGETPQGALIRELREELSIDVSPVALVHFGTFEAIATGTDKRVVMEVFSVPHWDGAVVPTSEVEETRWIDGDSVQEIELSSIFLHDVLPRLCATGIVA